MKPFLKWAGGKARLAPRIASMLPSGQGRLIEPFVGSGSVFLGVGPRQGGYLLADANPDLVTLYKRLVAEPETFVSEVTALFTPETNTREGFNALRAAFNALPPGDPGRAPIFVYLNRHSFNGLCRYNRQGSFNVPWGQYTHTSPPTQEMLDFARFAAGAEFVHADFREIMSRAVPGDVVYCDPPYVPLSPTASFDGYAAGGFSSQDQRDMSELCRELARKGVPVLVSNHDTPFTREIYQGAEIISIDVRRSVSASSGSRGKAPEVLASFHVPGSEGEAEWLERRAEAIRAAALVAAFAPVQPEATLDDAPVELEESNLGLEVELVEEMPLAA